MCCLPRISEPHCKQQTCWGPHTSTDLGYFVAGTPSMSPMCDRRASRSVRMSGRDPWPLVSVPLNAITIISGFLPSSRGRRRASTCTQYRHKSCFHHCCTAGSKRHGRPSEVLICQAVCHVVMILGGCSLQRDWWVG